MPLTMKGQTRKIQVLLVRSIVEGIVFISLFAGSARANLVGQVDEVISQSLQHKVRFSICIVEAGSGRIVYEHDANELMIPASNMKIITTAAALKYLGPDFEYITKVGLVGHKLVIIGSGDPLLGDEITDEKYHREQGWIFKDITEKLKNKGVSSIEDIIVDTGIFDDECVHPNWPPDQLNRSYACEISGLNYNLNCIKLSARNIGGQIDLVTEPQTSFVTLINEVKPIASGESALGTYRNRQPNKLTVHGECRNEVGPIEVAIERPAAFFGYLLFEYLTQNGITTKGRFVEKILDDSNELELLAEYKTSMTDCLDRCHKDSLNLGAEALLKTIAAVNNPDGRNGSWQRGRELIGEYLQSLGIDQNQFNIDDGCGLSRFNKLSARTITKVLSEIYHSDNWNLYRDSLAVGGIEGTKSIADNFKQDKYKGKILGKSGYINGVKSLSGVCLTAKGDYIFSVLANDTNGQTRDVINDIAKIIIDEADGNQ